MKVLLDTHSLLWFSLGDARLSMAARAQIDDPLNEKLVSPASCWEIAIKISVGKYSLSTPYDVFIQRAIFGNGFTILPIMPTHTQALITLPFHHKDPFDRILIAQSHVESLPIISNESLFDSYGVTRLW